MIQGGENFGFALEPGQPLRVSCEGVGQHLDRHVAVERRIVGAVDLAHAARADLGGDLVDAEFGAGLK